MAVPLDIELSYQGPQDRRQQGILDSDLNLLLHVTLTNSVRFSHLIAFVVYHHVIASFRGN